MTSANDQEVKNLHRSVVFHVQHRLVVVLRDSKTIPIDVEYEIQHSHISF